MSYGSIKIILNVSQHDSLRVRRESACTSVLLIVDYINFSFFECIDFLAKKFHDSGIRDA